MPRHDDVTCLQNQWTILTDAADATITGVRFQSVGKVPVRVQAKADNNPAGLAIGGSILLPVDGAPIIFSTETLASLFPGVTSPLHLFGMAVNASGLVSVSHA